MSPDECIAALDSAIAASGYEEIILRRVVGRADKSQNIDVKCFAQVRAVSVEEIAGGATQTDLMVTLSPSQINRAQWPGGHVPQLPPFDVDQRVPRSGNDKAIVRGRLRVVGFGDAKFRKGVLVRIDMRVTG